MSKRGATWRSRLRLGSLFTSSLVCSIFGAACGGRSALNADGDLGAVGMGGAGTSQGGRGTAGFAGTRSSSGGMLAIGGAFPMGGFGTAGFAIGGGGAGPGGAAGAGGVAGAGGAIDDTSPFETIALADHPLYAAAISADGRTVVGYIAGNVEAFRWTHKNHVVPLGFFPGVGFGSSAFAVSADGSVVVGTASHMSCASCAFYQHAAQWHDPGPEDLGILPLRHNAYATAVTGDAEIIVGYQTSNAPPLELGFAVTKQQGMFPLSPGTGTPLAISADGRVLVGYVITPTQLIAARFSRQGDSWQGEATPLGVLPSTGSSAAYATNADGSVVVGTSYAQDSTGGAFRWTAESGMVALDALPGDKWASARGVSADGSVMVGTSSRRKDDADSQGRAVIWDEAHGVRRLDKVLSELGADMAGVTPVNLVGVSADGSIVVGNGYDASLNDVAFIARLAVVL